MMIFKEEVLKVHTLVIYHELPGARLKAVQLPASFAAFGLQVFDTLMEAVMNGQEAMKRWTIGEESVPPAQV